MGDIRGENEDTLGRPAATMQEGVIPDPAPLLAG